MSHLDMSQREILSDERAQLREEEVERRGNERNALIYNAIKAVDPKFADHLIDEICEYADKWAEASVAEDEKEWGAP